MTRKYLQSASPTFTYCIKAIIFALSVSLLFPMTVLAHSHMLESKQSTCMQAPANLDPTTLSEAQLRAYGLPLRPNNSQAQANWLKEANRIKLDRHICNPQLITGPKAHHSTHPHSTAIHPNVTQYTTPYWAGNYATGSQGSYTFSSANWNLPCTNTSVRNANASFWLGLGGFVRSGWLVQAGTDVIVDGNGNVSYTAWVEAINGVDNILTYPLTNARCGNTMYVEVDSNYGGNGVDYYVINGGGINLAFSKNWPISVGDTGECMVERPNVSVPLAQFNYIAFSNCQINGNGIGNLPHNYDIITNSSGQLMAGVGPISSSGTDYNVTWYRAS